MGGGGGHTPFEIVSKCRVPRHRENRENDKKRMSCQGLITTNYVNWQRENLRLDREKTGKTQGIGKNNLSGYPEAGL